MSMMCMIRFYSSRRAKLFSFALLLTSLLNFSCFSSNSESLKGSEYLLVGSGISEHDRMSGITQASPGAGENSGEQATQGDEFVVPEDKSLLRFKVFDDPVPNADTRGLLHFVLEYDRIESVVRGAHHGELADGVVAMDIEKIILHRVKPSSRSRHPHARPIIYRPTAKEGRVLLVDGRHYLPVVRNLSLEAGEYRYLKVIFKKNARLTTKDGSYNIRLTSRMFHYHRKFNVQAGKITTLNAESLFRKISRFLRNRHWHRSFRFIRHHHHRRHPHHHKKIYHLGLRLFLPSGESVHDPIERVFVRFLRVDAVNNVGAGFLLNDTPSEFELLSLRDGAVGLMGHNMLPEGLYRHFQLTLDEQNHRVVIGGQEIPLTIEKWSQNVLRFMGPFDLRGGRITEVFLHFDPNSSIFYTRDRGFILDPTVMTTSVISMTPRQDLRIIQALGPKSNQVVSESEVIFEGNVTQLETAIAENISGRKMIYSDLNLRVDDRLRGEIEDPNNFPLRMPGGEKDGKVLRVKGMPEFQAGENLILFLKKYGERYSTVRGNLGKVELD